MLLGEPASPGVARGTAFVYGTGDAPSASLRTIPVSETAQEMQRFDAAIAQAERELQELQARVQKTVGKQESEIFGVQILLLRDPSLRAKASALCLERRVNAEFALEEAVNTLIAAFTRLEDAYFRERAADLQDVGKRVLSILTKGQQTDPTLFPEGSIVVVAELLPSLMVQLDGCGVRAVIAERGGQTAHATVLARARGIPVLIQVPEATARIHTGDALIVDGMAGRVFINPIAAVGREYDRSEEGLKAHQTALKGLIDEPCISSDGVVVRLFANIGKSADTIAGAAVNADGAGLYRTEFVFLVQDHLPSEEEQFRIYRSTADRLTPKQVTVRVLDIGSDKLLPYFPLPREDNPSLGLRGTRLLLAYPEVLRAQLRAILRLSATHPVSILFPMVGGVAEMRAAIAEVEKAKVSLAEENLAFDPAIPIGAMIETPAAAIMVERLAREVDFLSVGTNDLVQYLLATDRTGSAVAFYYEPLHPAVLQVLASMAATTGLKQTPISICGEMAGNPMYTALLLGLGYRSFSVSPGELLEVKNAIRSTNVNQAADLARQALELVTVAEVKKAIRDSAGAASSHDVRGIDLGSAASV